MQYAKIHERNSGRQGGQGTLGIIMDFVVGFGVILLVITILPGTAANYLHKDLVHPVYYWQQAIDKNCGDLTNVVKYDVAAAGSVPAFHYDSSTNPDQVTQCMQIKQGTIDLATQFWIGIQNIQMMGLVGAIAVIILGVLGMQMAPKPFIVGETAIGVTYLPEWASKTANKKL